MRKRCKIMYLLFDIETTGLPIRRDAPVSDIDNWPRIVQIAWLLCDNNGKILKQKDYIIKPDGFEIPMKSVSFHGITTDFAQIHGKKIKTVLDEFLDVIDDKSIILVVHNYEFDGNCLGAEYFRILKRNPLDGKKVICTKLRSTNFCKIPSEWGGNKWPTLEELHEKLFREKIKEKHRATFDVKTLRKCFFEMVKREII